MSNGNFNYVTYRPLSGGGDGDDDDRNDVDGPDEETDDDALLDNNEAADALTARDLTLRLDTEDEDEGSEDDSVSLSTSTSSSRPSILTVSVRRILSPRRNRVFLSLLVGTFVVVVVISVIFVVIYA